MFMTFYDEFPKRYSCWNSLDRVALDSVAPVSQQLKLEHDTRKERKTAFKLSRNAVLKPPRAESYFEPIDDKAEISNFEAVDKIGWASFKIFCNGCFDFASVGQRFMKKQVF